MAATKANHMTIDAALALWSKLHRKPTGCVAATYWFCMRVPSFKPLHLQRYTENGDIFEHVVAYNGIAIVDLAHGHNSPRNYDPRVDGVQGLSRWAENANNGRRRERSAVKGKVAAGR
jgi:hypothetical protein